MKNLLYLFIASTLIFTACKKDDDCDAGSLATAIIGEWDVRLGGIDFGDVEFHANGDLTDDGEFLIDNQISGTGETTKTYTVKNNTTVTIRAENDSNFEEYDINVNSYDCEEIEMDVLFSAVVLRRK